MEAAKYQRRAKDEICMTLAIPEDDQLAHMDGYDQ